MVERLDASKLRPAASGEAPRVYAAPFTSALPEDLLVRHLKRIAALGFDWLLIRASGDPEAIEALARTVSRHRLRTILQIDPLLATEPDRWRSESTAGYFFDKALLVPGETWRLLLGRLRRKRPDIWLVAEAVGQAPDGTGPLADAGFDWFVNSLAWWDMRDAWFVEQHRSLPPGAKTLSTVDVWPEPGLVRRYEALGPVAAARALGARYALATFASSGLVCPLGYEIGMAKAGTDAVTLLAGWDSYAAQAAFDLSGDIRALNGLKSRWGPLRDDGDLRLASAPGSGVLALSRPDMAHDTGPVARSGGAVLLVNTTDATASPPPLPELVMVTGTTHFAEPLAEPAAARPLRDLEPHESRILLAEHTPAKLVPTTPGASEKRLTALAKQRLVIEAVSPAVNGGRFPAKAVLGESLQVEADIFMDGQDVLAGVVRYRPASETEWRDVPLAYLDNDRWTGAIPLEGIGRVVFTLEAWRDLFATWQTATAKKVAAGQKVSVELAEAKLLFPKAIAAAPKAVKAELRALQKELDTLGEDAAVERLFAPETHALFVRSGFRDSLTRYDRELEVTVDRPLAACAAWYEVLPRSQSGDVTRHGTFDDVIARLPYVRDLGFDVLYFPPIHPIGRTNRKGKNNSLTAGSDDPGSPYAIGSEAGGHEALHPELGGFDAFERLIRAAREVGIEIAIDFAIQCSPDHPWIQDHPEWFDWRPDGTIKYAENPPKKYEDIVNPHFYRDALPSLWIALRDVILFWIDKGVTIFRVDNPHTKPMPFWEWMIRDVQSRHPEAMFLSEAFTRPKRMRRLAKAGFTQSYSYFTWRNTKQELTDYLVELTKGEAADYMRPNFFVNTPDINPIPLRTSGRAGFRTRLVLAATLNPLYGLYNGFELCEAAAVPGKEEYAYSEKYELKAWDWDRVGHIKDDVRLINRIRRENPAFWRFTNLTFLNAWNDQVIGYYKTSVAGDNLVVVLVNLDPHNGQSVHFEVPLWEFGLPDHASIDAVDLATGRTQTFAGKMQHYWLDPGERPYALWRLIPPSVA